MTTREVVLDGGSPWGFRLHGGADVNQPLRISRVNPGSKAALRGIREGDYITSINNQSTKDITNAEAHSLLKNSGDTLKLGLNEDCNGSPKRRQYKTVHQETHSETVKKSSITSYSLTSSKTTCQTETSNEQKASNLNGSSAGVNGGDSVIIINEQTRHPVASQRSTLSSNCSSSSSTASTYTDPSVSEMPDRRRKRARNHRKKPRTTSVVATEVVEEEASGEVETRDEYRVESPKLPPSKDTNRKTVPVKSRSLDDDDLLKIQELSEASDGDDKTECKAIVSEAESDVEWEVTTLMEEPELHMGVLSSLSLPLETYTTEQVSLISPEEELTLRNFLEGLNLVNSPEDAAKRIQEVSTMESIKSRRARKRAALEQYFNPIIQNPRYLDVINEETSDLSDKEQSLTHHLKQGTPEPEIPPTNTAKLTTKKERKLQSRMQSHFPAPISNPTILVGAKIIDVPIVGHGIYSTSSAQPSDKAELVYLEDSSNSTSPDPKSDKEEVASSNKSSLSDLLEDSGLKEGEEENQVSVSVKKDDVVSLTEQVEKKEEISDGKVINLLGLITPPPTPVDRSPKNGTLKKVVPTILQSSTEILKKHEEIKANTASYYDEGVQKNLVDEDKQMYLQSSEENNISDEETRKSDFILNIFEEQKQKLVQSENTQKTLHSFSEEKVKMAQSKTTNYDLAKKTEASNERNETTKIVSNTECAKNVEETKSKPSTTERIIPITIGEERMKKAKSEMNSNLGFNKCTECANTITENKSEFPKTERVIPVSIEENFEKKEEKIKCVKNITGNKVNTEKIIPIVVEESGKKNGTMKLETAKTERIIPITVAEKRNKKEESKSELLHTFLHSSLKKEENRTETTKSETKCNIGSYQNTECVKSLIEKKPQSPKSERIIPISVEKTAKKNEEKINKNMQSETNSSSFKYTERAKNITEKKSEPSKTEKIIPVSIEEIGKKMELQTNVFQHTECIKKVEDNKPELPKTERIIPVSVDESVKKNNTQPKYTECAKNYTEKKSELSKTERIIPISVEETAKKNEEIKSEATVSYLKEYAKNIVEKKLDSSKLEKIIPITVETPAKKSEEKANKETKSEATVSCLKEYDKNIVEKKLNSSKMEKIIPVTLETPVKKSEEKVNKETKSEATVSYAKNIVEKKLDSSKTEKIIPISVETPVKKNEENVNKEVQTEVNVSCFKGNVKNSEEKKLHSSQTEKIIPISVEERRKENEESSYKSFQSTVAEKETKLKTPKYIEYIKSIINRKPEIIKTERIIPISVEERRNINEESKTESAETVTTNQPAKSERIIPITVEENAKKSEESVRKSSEEKEKLNEDREHPKKNPIETSPSKEVEKICSSMKTIFTNVLSPPGPSPSPSLSSGSSSRATSLCTAKYNPLSSSIADISSISEESSRFQPPTLRELCLNFFISKPYGVDVLQELAEVSESIEALTSRISDEVLEKKSALSSTTTGVEPLFSPTRAPDLPHDINRTSYHEIKSIKDEAKSPSANRLLAIIRDETNMKTEESPPLESDRLKAKDLNEWLRLARNKSTSLSNLTEVRPVVRDRRTSLPHEFYQEQMLFLQEKEREIQKELENLEEEKKKLVAEMGSSKNFRLDDFRISKKEDFAEHRKSRPASMPSTEYFRQQMYEEYLEKMAKREERKQHNVIKVTDVQKSGSETKPSTGIEDEFMDKVKEKQKLGKLLKIEDETCEENRTVPKHLREFADFAKTADDELGGVWSPGQKQPEGGRAQEQDKDKDQENKDEPISPVWTPKSATSSPTVERKEFRPVKFESPVLSRKNYVAVEEPYGEESCSKEPPWTSSEAGQTLSSALQKRLPTSHSSPASGFNDFAATRLPKAQNPTITLLQKAREGQLPKGALYIDQDPAQKRPQNGKPPLVGPGEILYKIKNEYTSESDTERPRKMVDLGPRKFEGIGPTTRDGMPLILRSEVKDSNQSKWYKKMYDTIHKQRPHKDEFVTVRYKQRRGQYPYTSGYLSEPEHGAYDSDITDYKYQTLDRRRHRENDYLMSSTMPRSGLDNREVIKHTHDPYKNQPGRIENYVPGHSSISEKEAKEWWDEVMDIFDGHLEQQKRVPQTKSFMNQALKESGYESDSTLVFRRRDDAVHQLSPSEQKEAYKIIQKGGDIPLHGLRKPAPERPKESPRKYVENEVTIHYKTPVRQEIKEYLSEDELAYRQAEAMKKIYQEERRRKYLQELQDMNNRRHTDNFIPSQKSPIPLNRYDDFDEMSPPLKPRPRSPEPRLIARALYNFVGQTARELTFRKGDLIYVRRQVDKNWYEGELNAMVGLFPVNYVEIVPYDTVKSTPRKSHEGQARAKYNFVAQTHLELSLAKGELVVITRRVDDNWFEGKIGGRKGIFPVSYVEVLIDPSDPPPPSSKPVAAPAAHSLLLNGSAGGKESMGSHSYTPNLSANQLTTSYHAKPVQVTGNYGSIGRNARNPVNQTLHIETQAEPVPYRALYKYLPQNDDELELLEGDTVYVLEKCDDGWYVGSSERTGAFGTFPGNYVEKI